ncbi:MAG: PA14 domain-containing protein [Anaerolineae bacterium]
MSEELPESGPGSSLKGALVAVGVVAAVTVGLIILVYYGIMKNRITTTPTSQAANTVAKTGTAQATAQLLTVTGTVKEYSPGALIAIIAPAAGNIEQIIITEETKVQDPDGKAVSLSRVKPGVTITCQGSLDPLGRMIAQTIVITPVSATASPAPGRTPINTNTPALTKDTATPEATEIPVGAWLGSYYDNRDLQGEPVLYREDPVIDFQWGDSAPGSGVPADNFSVLWEGIWNFDAGGIRITALTDDGVRVWVDDVLVIDAWLEQAPTLTTADVYMQAGQHHIKVEYFDASGGAQAKVWWDFRGQFPEWKAEYYNNINLSGDPVLVRNDENITFDWGQSAPAPQVPTDHFSVRWTRTLAFDEGSYRFTATVNDGVRIWIDGALVLDQWQESAQATYVGFAYLTSGSHNVKVEYFDNTDNAVCKVSWERLNTFANWRGDYFSNPDLAGNPTLVRDDAEIKFSWGTAAPAANLPADNFSVRWTRVVALNAGTYRFYVNADDGVRIKVDGATLVDAWTASAGNKEAVLALAAGNHTIVVEFLEKSGDAFIEFGWAEAATMTPTPTQTVPTPTYTPEPSATPTVEDGIPTATPTLTPTTEVAPGAVAQ